MRSEDIVLNLQPSVTGDAGMYRRAMNDEVKSEADQRRAFAAGDSFKLDVTGIGEFAICAAGARVGRDGAAGAMGHGMDRPNPS